MTLPTRPLGTTGMDITTVGFGAWAVGGPVAWPGVTAAIVGGRSPEQVDGWLPGASVQLTDADLEEITAAVESTGAGQGPVRD